MTDVHRRFLQLLMTHGVLEEWDVKRLQKHCYKVHDCECGFAGLGRSVLWSGTADMGRVPCNQSAQLLA